MSMKLSSASSITTPPPAGRTPCIRPPTTTSLSKCCCHLTQPFSLHNTTTTTKPITPITSISSQPDPISASARPAVGDRWMEYQGIRNWEGMLDPLDDHLRAEILRYGDFVQAAYNSFDFDASSPTYATCLFPESTLLQRASPRPETGYHLTKNLHATSGIQPPRWTEMAPAWASTRSSWIGYVAVCQDKDEIARLGRRDVVIAYRGTATCLEWVENLRANLARFPGPNGPMVESGFLSLYTSGSETGPSLQTMVREEIRRILETYGDEPLSLTVTGHSLGAALATLTAYDVKTTFKRRAPLVTVVSFGGPRVGNRSFRQQLEKQGTKVLRIVNSDDVVTKVPGFVVEEDACGENVVKRRKKRRAEEGKKLIKGGGRRAIERWMRRCVEETRWVYAEVGRELRLSSKDSPDLNGIDVATCHDLKTYLHLVNGFVSSSCPFRATARRVIARATSERLNES